MNEPPWLVDYRDLPSLEMYISISVLGHDLYYGPNGKGNETYGLFRVDLEQPGFTRQHASGATMREIIGHEAELAAYYERLLLLARDHDLPFSRIGGYFCLHLEVWNGAHDVHFGVTEPDTSNYAGISGWIDEISSKEAGLAHVYYDQGWSFEWYAKDGRLYFRESGDDDVEPYAAFSISRLDFLREAMHVRERTTAVITELTRFLGADVWTRSVWQPNFYLYRNDAH